MMIHVYDVELTSEYIENCRKAGPSDIKQDDIDRLCDAALRLKHFPKVNDLLARAFACMEDSEYGPGNNDYDEISAYLNKHGQPTDFE